MQQMFIECTRYVSKNKEGTRKNAKEYHAIISLPLLPFTDGKFRSVSPLQFKVTGGAEGLELMKVCDSH